MIFGNFFKKKPDSEKPLDQSPLCLKQLVPGDLLTYAPEQRIYEVTALALFRWEDATQELTEWTLTSGDDRRLLRHLPDLQPSYQILSPLEFSALGANLADQIIDQDDPPATLHFDGKSYVMADSQCGMHRAHKGAKEREFLIWMFKHEGSDNLLILEQWGDRDFRAYQGRSIEEGQCTNLTVGRRLNH